MRQGLQTELSGKDSQRSYFSKDLKEVRDLAMQISGQRIFQVERTVSAKALRLKNSLQPLQRAPQHRRAPKASARDVKMTWGPETSLQRSPPPGQKLFQSGIPKGPLSTHTMLPERKDE